MHVVVSTSLQTSYSRLRPTPGTLPACPEILTISVPAWLMPCLRFLDFHQKCLAFLGMCVGVCGGVCQEIRGCPRIFSRVLCNSPEPLMYGEANLIDLLSIDGQR